MDGMPYVLLSAAMSADGYVDDASPRRLLLSGQEDLDRVDAQRALCDAIMVGARTIRTDNPRLLVRSPQRQLDRQVRGLPAQPAKVTLTASGQLDPDLAFFAADGAAKLVYAAGDAAEPLRSRLQGKADVIGIPAGHGGSELAWVLTDLAGRGVSQLMIEGGPRMLGQAVAAGLADELQLAIAPVLVADPAAPRLLAPGESGAGHLAGGRMVLAGVVQVGDCAVLRYLPGGRRGR